MAKKETIIPPKKPATSEGSKLLKAGSSAGGRVMADKSVAVREGVAKGKPPKKR